MMIPVAVPRVPGKVASLGRVTGIIIYLSFLGVANGDGEPKGRRVAIAQRLIGLLVDAVWILIVPIRVRFAFDYPTLCKLAGLPYGISPETVK